MKKITHKLDPIVYLVAIALIAYPFVTMLFFRDFDGLAIWKAGRNIAFAFFFVLVVFARLGTFKPGTISAKAWVLSLLLTVFSWVIGGFLADLLVVIHLFRLQS